MTDSVQPVQLTHLIACLNRMIEEDLARRLQPDGLTIEHFRILKALEQERPLAMGALASRVLVEPATLTKIIDRMASEGLVFRLADPKDRRKVMISLTEIGENLVSRILAVDEEYENHILQFLSETEQRDMRRTLAAMLRNSADEAEQVLHF